MKTIMKLLVVLFISATYGQTDLSIGAGLLEQSRVLGVGIATSVAVSQPLYKNFGVTAIYTHGFLNTGDSKLIVPDGNSFYVLSQAPHGTKWNQLQIMANFKVYTNDDRVAIRFNGGVARQLGNVVKPTFGLDLIAFPNNRVYTYLSWSPVILEKFDTGSGWSHTVTLNLAVRL